MYTQARLGLATLTLALVACTAAPGASPSLTASPTANPPGSPAPTPGSSPSPNQTGPAGIDERQFLSVSVTQDGEPLSLVEGTRIRITFGDGNIGAQAGCNSIGGSYRLDGDELIVDNLGMTEMGCNPPLHDQDEWLAAFLTSRPTVTLDGPNLTLATGDTTISLVDSEVAEPDQQLVGPTWVLDSIVAGDAVASVPDGVMATLRFLPDGTVEVQPGCNSGSGQYAVDGDRIMFRDIILTRMACVGPAGQVESDVLTVLTSNGVQYSIDAGTLTLQADIGGLIFRAE